MNEIKRWTDKEFIKNFWVAKDKDGDIWLDYGKFVNDPINKDCEFFILVGENGIGKSYSMEEEFFKELEKENGNINIWGRLTNSEASRCVIYWNNILKRHGINADNGMANKKKEWTVNTSGVYRYGELKLPFVYVKNIAISQPPIEGLVDTVIDEILMESNAQEQFKRTVTFSNPIKLLMMLQDRARVSHQDKVPRTFLIANLHTPESDFFTNLQYYPSFEKLHGGESDIFTYMTSTKLKVSVCVIGDNLIKDICKINKKIARQQERNERIGIVKYPIPEKELQRIIPEPKGIEFYAQISYEGKNNYFSFYKFEKNKIYIKHEVNVKAPCFCLNAEDHSELNTYLATENSVYKIFQPIIDLKHSGDRIYYDSPYTRDIFDNIINDVEYTDLS